MSEWKLVIGWPVDRETVAGAICRGMACDDNVGAACESRHCLTYIYDAADAVLKLVEREVEVIGIGEAACEGFHSTEPLENGELDRAEMWEAAGEAVLAAAGLKVEKVKEDEPCES